GVYIQGADTYALWVDNDDARFDGNVNIGVNSTATYRLDVAEGSNGSGEEIVARFEHWGDSIGDDSAIVLDPAGNGAAKLVAVAPGSNDSDFALYVSDNGSYNSTAAVYVDGDGNKVGLGDETPDTLLDILGAAASGTAILSIENTTTQGELIQASNTNANKVFELGTDGSEGGYLQVLDNAGTKYIDLDPDDNGAKIRVEVPSTANEDSFIILGSSNNYDSGIKFREDTSFSNNGANIYYDGSANNLLFETNDLTNGTDVFLTVARGTGEATFRTHIDSTSGFEIDDADGGTSVFLVDTTNERIGISDDSPAYKLEVGGGDVNTTAGGYRDAGSCVAGTCASDERLKTNVEELGPVLDKLTQLQPSTYQYIDEQYGSTENNYGLIAQEVEPLFADWVVEGDDGYKKIRYGLNIQMSMLQGIIELDEKVDNLANELEAIQSQLDNSTFTDLNVSGTASVNDLVVTGTASIAELVVSERIALGDNKPLVLGTDSDAELAYDEAGENRVELTGNNANLFIEDRVGFGTDVRTIAGSGDNNLAQLMLNPKAAFVKIICDDSDGCEITLGEGAGVEQGNIVFIYNDSNNDVSFTDTSGVSELSGNFAAGRYDTISLIYEGDRWIELSRSNN
ncbi:MAG: tail fiber domain-containing protein, partial [Candidatus Saccharimonadales bacterium]|nr:tail fiber domain-containing protein [Candidatus Saccharimonadales bacterium]